MLSEKLDPIPFVVGLTGGIGSGKTTVSDQFAAMGIPVVDTDLIAHALTGPDGAAMPALVATFGPTIQTPEGRLDRLVMRQKVFADVQARRCLEEILHPMIRELAVQACQAFGQRPDVPYVLLVVPLLVESGSVYQRLCQRIVVVDCDPEVQIVRVMQRNNFSRTEVEAMLRAQATRDARLAIATDVILNEGQTEDQSALLESRVLVLDQLFRKLAKDYPARTA